MQRMRAIFDASPVIGQGNSSITQPLSREAFLFSQGEREGPSYPFDLVKGIFTRRGHRAAAPAA